VKTNVKLTVGQRRTLADAHAANRKGERFLPRRGQEKACDALERAGLLQSEWTTSVVNFFKNHVRMDRTYRVTEAGAQVLVASLR
jgi:hypothetical protein